MERSFSSDFKVAHSSARQKEACQSLTCHASSVAVYELLVNSVRCIADAELCL